jgi:hypothetical protein
MGREDKIQYRLYPGDFTCRKKRSEKNSSLFMILYICGFDESNPYRNQDRLDKSSPYNAITWV